MGFFSKKSSEEKEQEKQKKAERKVEKEALKAEKKADKNAEKKSKGTEKFHTETLISDVDYSDGEFKLGLAQKFNVIGYQKDTDQYKIEVEHFFAEGEELPDHADQKKSEKGQKEPLIAEKSGHHKIVFTVPAQIIQKARERRQQSEAFEKAQMEDLEYFQTLDLKNKDTRVELSMKGLMGNTLLHLVVKKSVLELVQFFIQNSLIDINETNDIGNTPLMELVSMRKPTEASEEILEYLMNTGAKLDVINKSGLGVMDLTVDERLRTIVDDHKANSIGNRKTTGNPLDVMFVAKQESEDSGNENI